MLWSVIQMFPRVDTSLWRVQEVTSERCPKELYKPEFCCEDGVLYSHL